MSSDVSGNVNELDNRRVRSVRRTRQKKVMMMTNKTHRTATCQLLAKVALVGAAIAVPMTAAAVPAMAAPTPVPGVVQVDRPWGDGGWGDGGSFGSS
jgi:hypothetical protein